MLALLGSGSAGSLAAPAPVARSPGAQAVRPVSEDTGRTGTRFSDGDLATGAGAARLPALPLPRRASTLRGRTS